MFLVHAHFEVQSPSEVPYSIDRLTFDSLIRTDAVEHLSLHPLPPSRFVLGFYLLSESLAEAESRTDAICRQLLDDARLPPARLVSVGVPLIAPLLSQ